MFPDLRYKCVNVKGLIYKCHIKLPPSNISTPFFLVSTHLVCYLLILESFLSLSLLIHLLFPHPILYASLSLILKPLSLPVTAHFVALTSALAQICTAGHGALSALK